MVLHASSQLTFIRLVAPVLSRHFEGKGSGTLAVQTCFTSLNNTYFSTSTGRQEVLVVKTTLCGPVLYHVLNFR
jgi:hypothetical protein